MMYREMADRDAYCLLGTRQIDNRWQIPERAVEPGLRSRMALNSDPDCGELPPDDPAANGYMRHPYRFHNHKYWDRIPQSDVVDEQQWWEYLPRSQAGLVEVTPELAIDLSLLHSRDFQTRYEQVYLNCLSLSGNRFDFLTQWSGGAGSNFNAAGTAPNSSRLLTVADRLGLAQQLAAGGQFATNLVNSFAFELGGNNFTTAGGSIVATLTQPLMRGAGRYVRLESLTQAERNLLYDVRSFAHFRREFHLDVVSSYYVLLAQVQSISNSRTNLKSLELNLAEHEELYSLRMVSLIQIDQVFQQYQSGRASLLSSEQSLADSLDRFKFQLGLPPWVEIKIDETLLQPFDLNDPRLTELQDGAQNLYLELLKYLPPDDLPSDEQLADIFQRMLQQHQAVKEMYPVVEAELADWQSNLRKINADTLSADDRVDFDQQSTLAERAVERFTELAGSLKEDDLFHLEVAKLLRGEPAFEVPEEPTQVPLPQQPADEKRPQVNDPQIAVPPDAISAFAPQSPQEKKWRRIYEAVGRRLRERVAELFVAQNQARVFAIDLIGLKIDQDAAVEYAIENRLDLMNTKAQLTDAFRRVEISANALQSQLDVGATANLNTDPNKPNAFNFESSANTYSVNVQFDGPLNRFNERNVYRAAQIAYQQSRRQYMAAEDTVANTIRADLRQLRIGRLNFQIARQQLITATRQVDEAQVNLRSSSQANSNLTRDLLQALQVLLGAKNDLISNWINYRITKARLFVDLELLYLDEQGKWINEDFPLDQLAASVQDEYGLRRGEKAKSSEADETSRTRPGKEAVDSTGNGPAAESIDATAEPSELPKPNDEQADPANLDSIRQSAQRADYDRAAAIARRDRQSERDALRAFDEQAASYNARETGYQPQFSPPSSPRSISHR